jgi:PAS domain S-box-containing protein
VEIFRRNFPVFKQQGWIKDLEFRMVRKDGTVFTVLLNATAIYAPDGEFLYSRSTMFDITERKRAEEERDRFFTLSLDLICVAGFDGYFKRVNPAFEKALGYTEQELLAAPYLDFVHPDDCAATVAESIKLATGRDTIAFENRYRCKDGSYKWLLWSATPITEQQLIYAVAHDITERKRAEEEIRELNKRLEQRAAELEAAVQELEAFSYSVSHDLRAPLRHISGFTNILLENHGQKMEPEARRLFERVAQGARQMGTLIDDLLNLSRVSRRPLVQQLVGLSSLLEEARQAVEPEAQGRRIEWRISPLPFVECAPALLKIVFQNLLSNAVKFTRPRDPAVIEVGLEQVHGRTAVCVRDNGVGFSMKHAGKLFGVFQRLHRQEDFEGTGVGLATVQRIVRRHGGELWASAEPNRGAAFYFTLPGLQEAANLAPAAPSQTGVVS